MQMEDTDQGRLVQSKDLLGTDFEFLWTAPQKEHIEDLKSAALNISAVLEKCVKRLKSVFQFDMEEIGDTLRQLTQDEGTKTEVLMHSLRQALSGLKEGPPVAKMMTTLGKDNTIHRLKYTLDTLRTS